MADSYVLFMPIHLSPEGLSFLGICTVSALDGRMKSDPGLTPGACGMNIDVRVCMPRGVWGTKIV